MNIYSISTRSKIWLYQGDSPWHFLTIGATHAKLITQNYLWPSRGFGSIPVLAIIGKTKWKTSIFPDKNKTYILPLKKEIRVAESLSVGDTVTVEIQIQG